MQIIAIADSHEALVDAFKARRNALGLTLIDMDQLTGLADGLVSHIECRKKRLGGISLDCMLTVLDLELVVVPKGKRAAAAVPEVARQRNEFSVSRT